jgi:hypothetical protein
LDTNQTKKIVGNKPKKPPANFKLAPKAAAAAWILHEESRLKTRYRVFKTQ